MNVKDQMMLTSTARKDVVTEPPLKGAAMAPVKDGMAAMIMMKNQFEFEELKTYLNNQIQKYVHEEELDIQYTKHMAACKKRINWIFYQDMCAIKIAEMSRTQLTPWKTIRNTSKILWQHASRRQAIMYPDNRLELRRSKPLRRQ